MKITDNVQGRAGTYGNAAEGVWERWGTRGNETNKASS